MSSEKELKNPKTKKELISSISFNYLKKYNSYSKIIRKHEYHGKKEYVKAILRRLNKNECKYLYLSYKADIGPKKASIDFKRRYRPDEEVVKKEFLKYLKDKEFQRNDVIFTELGIGDNRTDINRFNGKSFTYELKSPRDTTKRLEDQINTYKKAFEYIYLVITEEKYKEIKIPDSIGIYTYNYPEFKFKKIKKAEKIRENDTKLQMNRLRIPELQKISNKEIKNHKTSKKRKLLINNIMKNHNNDEINQIFKEKIKQRYQHEKRKNA